MQVCIDQSSPDYMMAHDKDLHNTMKEYFADNQRKTWGQFMVGMGCIVLGKHDGTQPQSPVMLFFMHGDSWGQYGEATSDVPKMVQFIPDDYVCGSDCKELEEFITTKRKELYGSVEKIIKCPTCRQLSVWKASDPKVRFQLPEGGCVPQCIVCQNAEVSVVLTNCGHCVLCQDCALKM